MRKQTGLVRTGHRAGRIYLAPWPRAASAAADMASSGAGRPVQIATWRAAWWMSMPNPLAVAAPRDRAAASNGVVAGA